MILIISNSQAEFAYEPTSSDVQLLDIYNSSETTCVLFPWSHRVTWLDLCKKTWEINYTKCKITIGIRENGKLCVFIQHGLSSPSHVTFILHPLNSFLIVVAKCLYNVMSGFTTNMC